LIADTFGAALARAVIELRIARMIGRASGNPVARKAFYCMVL
jgi:hypothetical protein